MNWNSFLALLIAASAATQPTSALALANPEASTGPLAATSSDRADRYTAFGRLTLGMLITEVVAHMGDPSRRQVSQMLGVEVTSYRWSPPPLLGGEAFEVQFVMGRLVAKSMQTVPGVFPIYG